MLGLITEDIEIKFCKGDFDARDITTINSYLSDQREQHIGEDENPATAERTHLDVPHHNEGEIRNMLWKHYQMWPGQLAELNANEMRIDFVTDAKPFKSASYRYDSKTRKIEQVEIDNQLKAGIFEPVMLE